MMVKEDIQTLDDIKLLVDQFYGKIRENDLLGPIFDSVIKDKWPEHLDKMYRFWESILLANNTYNGRPFPPHAQLPVQLKHFDQWKALWFETLDELYQGEVADMAKWRATKIAEVFHAKITYFQNQ